MSPEQLRSWLPEATHQQLTEFIREYRVLFEAIENGWQQFMRQRTDLFQAASPTLSHYAESFSIEDLTHSPISPEEMAAFLAVFDAQRQHNDTPTDEPAMITQQHWEILP